MSRTTRFLSGVGFGYAGQALVMVTALWLTPFYLGRIGQHDYGLWLMGGQIIFSRPSDGGTLVHLTVPREKAESKAESYGKEDHSVAGG